MIEADPFFKWLIPAMAGVLLLLVLDKRIVRSVFWRWSVALLIALAVAPVPVPGCPGFSIEPAWTLLALLGGKMHLDRILSMLMLVGYLGALPVLVVTCLLGAMLEVRGWLVRRSGHELLAKGGPA